MPQDNTTGNLDWNQFNTLGTLIQNQQKQIDLQTALMNRVVENHDSRLRRAEIVYVSLFWFVMWVATLLFFLGQ